MEEKKICTLFSEIDNKVKDLTEEKKRIAWEVGIPALVEKMKRLNKSTLYLREAESEEDVWATESLWFWGDGGRFAARLLTLDEDGKLHVIYNTLWNNEGSYQSDWGYGEEDIDTEVTKSVSDNLITEILPELLGDDTVFEIEDEEEDEEEDTEDTTNVSDDFFDFLPDPDPELIRGGRTDFEIEGEE